MPQAIARSIDQIFDNLPVKLNQQVLDGTVAALKKDIDSLSWLCGYFASEINSTEDNQKPRHSIAELSKLLMTSGMEPFGDFAPNSVSAPKEKSITQLSSKKFCGINLHKSHSSSKMTREALIYPQLWNRRSDRLHWKVCDRTPGGVLRGNEGSDAYGGH